MPLAIAWPSTIPGGRRVTDLVNLIDVTATIYDATNVIPPFDYPLSGRSLMNVLLSKDSGKVDPTRDAVFSGRERHSSSRYNSLGYPQRSIRTDEYLYIWNLRPERWPAGSPLKYDKARYTPEGIQEGSILGPDHGGYHDIDACPSLDFLIANKGSKDLGEFFDLAVAKRPEVELYDIRIDTGCLKNLAGWSSFTAIERQLEDRLKVYLRQTGDARVVSQDGGEIWETYPRYSSLRWFPKPEWADRRPVAQQDWLESRRPRR